MKHLKVLLFIVIFLLISLPMFADTLEEGQSVNYELNNAKDVVIENPQLIKAERINDTTIKITALKRGLTYIYVWDQNNNLNTITMRIVPKGYSETVTLKEKQKKKAEESSDKTKVQVNFLAGNIVNKYGTQIWNVAQVGSSGETEYGKYNTFFQVERKDAYQELVLGFLQLKNPDYSLSLGDSWNSLSPLLGSYFKFQGAQLTDLKYDNFQINVLGGATGQKLWGSDVWSGPLNNKYFVGTKISTNLSHDISLYSNIFGVQSNYQNTVLGRYLLASVGSNMRFKPLNINSELALGKNNKLSVFLEGILNYETFSFSSQFKSIDKDFESLSDISQTNLLGTYNTASYRFWQNMFNIYGKFNSYKRSDLTTGVVNEHGAGISFYKDKYLPKIDISYWKLNWDASPAGSIYEGYQVYAAQNLVFLPSTVYLNYKPYTFDDPVAPLTQMQLTRYGINNDLGFSYLILEQTNEQDVNKMPSLLYTGKLIGKKFTFLKFYNLQFNFNFEAKYDYHLTNGVYDYSYKYLQGYLSCNSEFFDEIYVNYEKQYNSYANKADDIQDKLSFGIKTLFNPDISFMPKTWIVDGFFYEDLNRNGIRDGNEPRLSGFMVNNGKNNMATSSDSGYYKIRISENPYLEFSSDKYKFYKVCVSNPYKLELNTNTRHIQLDVPVSLSREVKAIVYFDANKNGRYDQDYDQLLPNTRLLLQDNDNIVEKIENTTGEVSFDINNDGKNYLVVIDYDTIPKELFPEDVKLLKQEIKANQSGITLYYPFIIQ